MTTTLPITILMPVYNAEQFVAQAVESILAQTHSDFAFIIINDGSTDSSLGILEAYARSDKRIQLVSRPNMGLVRTLNEGLSMIHSPLVARMDADDISLPTRIAKQIAYLNKNPQCYLLGTRVSVIDPDGDPICEFGLSCRHDELNAGLLAGVGQLIFHTSVVFRKPIVDQLGGYRAKYPHIEDLDLFLRVAEVGEIANLSEPLLQYREHPGKIGLTHSREQYAQICSLLAEVHDRRGLPYTQHQMPPYREASLTDTWMTWAWWALAAGNRLTARKYAWQIIRRRPFNTLAWKLAACVMRGH